jgi:hypothetical protein
MRKTQGQNRIRNCRNLPLNKIKEAKAEAAVKGSIKSIGEEVEVIGRRDIIEVEVKANKNQEREAEVAIGSVIKIAIEVKA